MKKTFLKIQLHDDEPYTKQSENIIVLKPETKLSRLVARPKALCISTMTGEKSYQVRIVPERKPL